MFRVLTGPVEQFGSTDIGCGLGELLQESSTTLEEYLDGFLRGLMSD